MEVHTFEIPNYEEDFKTMNRINNWLDKNNRELFNIHKYLVPMEYGPHSKGITIFTYPKTDDKEKLWTKVVENKDEQITSLIKTNELLHLENHKLREELAQEKSKIKFHE